MPVIGAADTTGIKSNEYDSAAFASIHVSTYEYAFSAGRTMRGGNMKKKGVAQYPIVNIDEPKKNKKNRER